LLNTGHRVKSFLKINCRRAKGVRIIQNLVRDNKQDEEDASEVNMSIQIFSMYLTFKTD